MKKLILPLILVGSLFASEQNYIELGGGVFKSKDNFSTESKKNISGLDQAENENGAFAYVELYYNYELSDSSSIYTNLGLDGLNFGSTIDSSIGTFDFGLKYSMTKEWENPFLTKSKRKETDVKELGAYLEYGFYSNPNYDASIRYEYSTTSYDKETLSKELKREGKRHILSFNNTFKTKLFDKDLNYIANLVYEKYNADGESSSYNSYGLEAGISTDINEKISLSFLSNVGKKKYKKFNNEVNKKVDVDVYGVNAILKWEKPFNLQNTYASFKTGYDKENANVDFYNKENIYGIVSLGYRF